jgi:hypothetical protein
MVYPVAACILKMEGNVCGYSSRKIPYFTVDEGRISDLAHISVKAFNHGVQTPLCQP